MGATSPPLDEERWVRVGDHHVNCRIRGRSDAHATVLYLPGIFLPIETMWDDPIHARLLDGLQGLGRIVVFDRRGVGASDPIVDWDEPVVGQWVRDAIAVVEAVGGPVHVFGWEWGGLQALLLAQWRPDLVATVSVLHGLDRPERLEAILGLPFSEVADTLAGWYGGEAAELAGEEMVSSLYHPSRVGDPGFARWEAQSGRRGASPSTAARMVRSLCTPGTGADSSAVSAPVLVMRRRGNPLLSQELAAQMVSGLADGRLVELPGEDLAPYAGDVDAISREVHRFVTGSAPDALDRSDRTLCAILFTDIVSSTERAAELGDARWRGVLDEHDQLTGRLVQRHGGRVIKTTGDGILAVFALASDALAAAQDLRAEVRAAGLEIRQGLHVGEVIERDDDLAGLAVHVAARLMGSAGAGEIAMSRAVPLVLGAGPPEAVVHEGLELRGVPGTWDVIVLGAGGEWA